jgi:hypothetical protein
VRAQAERARGLLEGGLRDYGVRPAA